MSFIVQSLRSKLADRMSLSGTLVVVIPHFSTYDTDIPAYTYTEAFV